MIASAKNSTVNIPAELHQRARAAVRIVERVTGRTYTIAQFCREAFIAQIAVIARDYNQGREIEPDHFGISLAVFRRRRWMRRLPANTD